MIGLPGLLPPLLGKRQATMDLALSLLPDRPVIVETGCARTPDNWSGDGLSTVVFGQHAAAHGGHVWTVDVNLANLETAASLCEGLPVTYALGDSVAYLRNWGRIDLLYLDSFDYPYGPLCDLYGGQTDLGAAIAALHLLTQREVVRLHGDLIGPSQQHCAREVRAALDQSPTDWPRLVLIDDAGLPGGGKARLAKRWLRRAGYTCLADDYQTLWARP